jgi:IS30 family transposase
LPEEKRRAVLRFAAQGLTVPEIVEAADLSLRSTYRVLRLAGGVLRPEMWSEGPGRLSLDDRVEIQLGLERGESFRTVGASLGRAASTVCREVNSNGGPRRYRCLAAHRDAIGRLRRPKPTKLASNPMLCARVSADLERLLSPEQIANSLRVEFGDDQTMTISHETIYKSLYVQGRGELRRELAACLRTGRAVRKKRGRLENRGRVAGMVMISERPPDVDDRAVPGHWEGDLIIGKDGASAIGTLVERSTRFVMLLHLPGPRTAAAVRTAMAEQIKTLPKALARTITWDQGREMAEHAQFTLDTGVELYFCDPHSPWQRGTNENTNGLLRQYFPKGTDLSVHTRADLDAVAASLNTRPRKTLGWMTPSAALNALLVASTG